MSESSKLISAKIDEIILRRKSKVAAITNRRDVLVAIRDAFSESADIRGNANNLGDQVKAMANGIIEGSRVPVNLLAGVDDLIDRYDAAIKRFSRDYISIATIGEEGQGKSTFLQSVGDIDNGIIPAYAGTSCTGATSIICNDSAMEKDTVRAVVYFRQPEDIVNIVKTYIDIMDPGYLKTHTISFDGIPYIQLENPDPSRGSYFHADEHLRLIISKFKEIKKFFGAPPLVITDKNEIKKFVAQYNGDDKSPDKGEQYFTYLAVEKADIFCPFYNSGVGKIRLIDTVGIGSTQAGIMDEMLKTVDEECDAAIVVDSPARGFDEGDTKIYDALYDRYRDRKMENWLFYLLNYRGGDISKFNQFSDKLNKNNLKVAGCSIINASKPDDVNEFMVDMLNTLLKNIDDIDNAYLNIIEEDAGSFKKKLNEYITSAPRITGHNTGVAIATFQLGAECYNNMAAYLSNQVSEWNKKRNIPNNVLWMNIRKIVNNLDNILSSEAEVNRLLQKNGTLMGKNIWETYLNYVRNKITEQFIAIDEPMVAETIRFKNDLVKVLYDTLKNLNVGNIKNSDDDYAKWLFNFMEPYLKDDPEFQEIYKALKFINDFEFNIRAQIILEIRSQLEIINPMVSECYLEPNFTFDRNNAAKAVNFYMQSRMAILQDNLQYSLSKMNQLPNRTFYAAAQELYDRLTFSTTLEDDSLVDMRTVWGNFFAKYGPTIFENDVGVYKQLDAVEKKYSAYLETLTELMKKL